MLGGCLPTGEWILNHRKSAHREIVWVTKAYNPIDLRSSAPVRRHKPLIPDMSEYKPTKAELLPKINKIDKCIVGRTHFTSTRATQCEDRNTLTLMKPTTGISIKRRAPNWGTAGGKPPKMYATKCVKHQYHKFSSPMTRYVDHMHHTNKLFKLH